MMGHHGNVLDWYIYVSVLLLKHGHVSVIL